MSRTGFVVRAEGPGRPPKLDDEQLQRVDEALREGAQAHGFGTDLWTLPRVWRTVIERVSGVRYHPGHVWKILTAMQWSLQRQARRAREGDSGGTAALGGGAVAGGKKNARRRKAWILFQDESGVSERPPVRRTWAPKGETPVLIHAFNWKKLSVCAALGYRWDGQRCRLWFQTSPAATTTRA